MMKTKKFDDKDFGFWKMQMRDYLCIRRSCINP